MISLPARIGEVLTLIFDFTDDLEKPWREGYHYSLGQYVTFGPFIYECTNAGKTDEYQPQFPTVIAETVEDGSVQWTCRDYSTLGSDTISTRALAVGSGLTVDSSEIQQSVRVHATVTATAKGRQPIVCSIETTAGETLKEKIMLVVQ